MPKNRNHYFKVKPGDDARLFIDVDIETEGFIARLRRIAHDCEPYGFLVDALRRRPYDAKKIADIVHLTNQRTTVVLAEAHSARLIETASQFRADLAAAAGKNKRARVRLEVFDEMSRELPRDISPGAVFVMPTLVDDFIDSEAGKRFGKDGGNPELVPFPDRIRGGDKGTLLTGPDKSQKSEVRGHSQNSESESSSPSVPERKREAATTARAKRVEITEQFARWLRMRVREIRESASLMAMAISEPDAYRDEIRTLTGYSPEELAELTGDDGILPFEPNDAPRTSAYVVRFREEKRIETDQLSIAFRSEIQREGRARSSMKMISRVP